MGVIPKKDQSAGGVVTAMTQIKIFDKFEKDILISLQKLNSVSNIQRRSVCHLLKKTYLEFQ